MKVSLARQLFNEEVNQPDEQIDLAKAALAIAQQEYPDLEVGEYLNALDTMAMEIAEQLPPERYPLKVLKTINQYLYTDLGFQGNSQDYYDPRNSFLNEVIERRTGIPISLALLYLEVAKRIDFPMVGIGMPGHFLIRPDFEDAEIFVDAFHQGEILFKQDCLDRLRQLYQQPVQLKPNLLEPVTNRQYLVRMLTNLKFIYIQNQAIKKALEMVEWILLLFPDAPLELRDRGLLYYQTGHWREAIEDLEIYLAMLPNAGDAGTIRQLLQKMKG